MELDVAMNGSVLEASVELLATVKAFFEGAGRIDSKFTTKGWPAMSPNTTFSSSASALRLSWLSTYPESAILEFIFSRYSAGTLATVPAGPRTQDDAPLELTLPGLQALQDEAPAISENLPAWHL